MKNFLALLRMVISVPDIGRQNLPTHHFVEFHSGRS